MAIFADNITKRFRRGKTKNEFTALKPTSFKLESGSLIALKGKSGSGKSTLINMVSGILKPTEGNVFYDGEDIYKLSDRELSKIRNQDFGYITQIHSPIASLNVIENILLPYTLFNGISGIKKGGIDDQSPVYERAINLMERLDMDHLRYAMPSELSGGELKRMMIIRALIKNPTYIFADEPTADLDEANTIKVFELFKNLASGGAAILVASHESEIEEYADKVYYIESARSL
ncbi:MAG: ABC transporter ATP-binding protein [Eubacterium sp.]|nr:ABC transporter ATP-binding protein [Eubacterium sp.]